MGARKRWYDRVPYSLGDISFLRISYSIHIFLSFEPIFAEFLAKSRSMHAQAFSRGGAVAPASLQHGTQQGGLDSFQVFLIERSRVGFGSLAIDPCEAISAKVVGG